MNLIKAHGGKRSRPFSFEKSATFPPQADDVLVDSLSFVAAGGRDLWAEPPQLLSILNCKSNKVTQKKRKFNFYIPQLILSELILSDPQIFNPLSSLSPPHSPLSIVRLFLTSMSLVIFCFLFFFFLFIMFQLKVRSYGICPSPSGLFHLT